MKVNGVAIMRRRSDSWLNATQILKVAGVVKAKRPKILEEEVTVGEHEKIQGGYAKYQGTWVNYQRAVELCQQYHVEELFGPLLEYDMDRGDINAVVHCHETPEREQQDPVPAILDRNMENYNHAHTGEKVRQLFDPNLL